MLHRAGRKDINIMKYIFSLALFQELICMAFSVPSCFLLCLKGLPLALLLGICSLLILTPGSSSQSEEVTDKDRLAKQLSESREALEVVQSHAGVCFS